MAPGAGFTRPNAASRTSWKGAASVLIVLSAICVFGTNAWGSAEGAFSAIDHDARGLAMGGACISLACGDAAAHWNPARLPYIPVRSVTGAYGELIEDLPSGLTTVSCAIPWGRKPQPEIPYDRGDQWAAGFFLSRLGFDDVADSEEWTETAFSGALARTILGYVSAGFSISYLNVSSGIEEGSAHGVSADLGLSVDTTDRTRAAIVIRNALGRLNWKSGRSESLPTTADLAFSYSHEKWASAELAFHFDADGPATTSIGLETEETKAGLVFWGGIKRHGTTSARNVPSFGVGVPAGGLMISYGASFDDDNAFGTAQRFSVSTRF